ncbi:transglycosylase SLT domain-containing protein [uncultured Acinetobacter sp.]|uniref:transglycosylase SLT domain-containing protein n=1 Tax=uncultured Acinetobacter sp. TaxID=165433 RepID=UPI002589D87C|nr:transglycosylase SLT domain-containing protein [uncultured Acinetobacter sp.]
MSINWAAAGLGIVNGVSSYKQEQKENEQRRYDRSRQNESDRQKLELHNQAVQQNNQTLETNTRALAEQQRRENLNKKIGLYQQFQQNGDLESAAKLYVDNANQDNIGNPNFNPDHALSYVMDPKTNTATINIVDKNTGALIKQARSGVSFNDMIGATYQQIDPAGTYGTQVASAAEQAKETRKNQFEVQKMGLQAAFDNQRDNNKFQNEYGMEQFKFGNNISLEQIRQQGATERTLIGQEGQNYRAENGSNSKSSKAVKSGVQGAIQFAQSNAPMLSFLKNDPNLYLKTMGMMAIESAGQNVTSYNGTSTGHMQLNKRYAQGFAKQYGIEGNPLTDPQSNIKTGAAHIQALDKKYGGDTSLIAASYNLGEPVVDNALKQWKQNGQKGGWFDYVVSNPNVSQAAKTEAYNHIMKYNDALNMLGKSDFVDQAKSTATTQLGRTIAGSVDSVAQTVAKELGEKSIAKIKGGLSGTQNLVSQFTRGKSTQDRANAFNAINSMVLNTLKTTEQGMMMNPQQLNNYASNISAQLVGASSLAEAGQWINTPKRTAQRQTEVKKPNATMSNAEIDQVFSADASPSAPSKKVIQNPFMNAGISSVLQNKKGTNTPDYLFKKS